MLLVSPEAGAGARGETESLGARTRGAEERRRVITKYSTRYIVTEIRSKVIGDRSKKKNLCTDKVEICRCIYHHVRCEVTQCWMLNNEMVIVKLLVLSGADPHFSTLT